MSIITRLMEKHLGAAVMKLAKMQIVFNKCKNDKVCKLIFLK